MPLVLTREEREIIYNALSVIVRKQTKRVEAKELYSLLEENEDCKNWILMTDEEYEKYIVSQTPFK